MNIHTVDFKIKQVKLSLSIIKNFLNGKVYRWIYYFENKKVA